MVSNKAGIHLNPAFWSTKDAGIKHTDEMAHTFVLRNADNKDIGHVIRQGDKWTFNIFGKDLPVGLYNTKEDARDAAASALA